MECELHFMDVVKMPNTMVYGLLLCDSYDYSKRSLMFTDSFVIGSIY